MHYEINVSLNGQHLFATADHSITDASRLRRVLPILLAKFPKAEGYVVGVIQQTATGRFLSDRQLAKLLA